MNISNGWFDQAKRIVSPNYNQRPHGTTVSLLVIHNISLPPNNYDNEYVELFFQNKLPPEDHSYFREIHNLEVSSHFYIRRNGDIVQFVSCEDRAWHAGKSEHYGRENCNDFSIGIELQGSDHEPYTHSQYESLAMLTSDLMNEYPAITKGRIVGHEHIAPGRKTDPGPSFDWNKYLNSL